MARTQHISRWLAGALAVWAPSAMAQSDLLDVAGRRPARVLVTLSDTPPGVGSEHESEMTRRLAGVVADLHGKDVRPLLACLPLNPFLGDPTGGERQCVLHLAAGDPKAPPRRVEVIRGTDGSFVAVELDPAGERPMRAELDRSAFAAMLSSWPLYRGGFGEGAEGGATDPVGQVFELPKPYVPGRVTMDKPTLGGRFIGRTTTNIDGADRVLDQESLFVRLPRGYDPKSPAGLLIWISPMPDGQPPGIFSTALDETGVICVGAANSGNDRQVANRYQLAFDALDTASRRYHIDPRRVYLTGMSGGGRVSSILLGCFPEVFTGAIPIVGVSFYENVPTGLGKAWPAGYRKPAPDLFGLLRRRPIAPMTGRHDFNQLEMNNAVNLMTRDGWTVRFFNYPDMAHELPKPERFREALAWVDEPYQRLRERERVAAQGAWETYVKRFGDKPPASVVARRMLVKVTAEGPWTPIAWRAVELLKAGVGESEK